jgi:hypothetical protein
MLKSETIRKDAIYWLGTLFWESLHPCWQAIDIIPPRPFTISRHLQPPASLRLTLQLTQLINMDKGCFNNILQHSEELKTWEPYNVFLEADDGSQVDLMDYVTDGKAERHSWVLLKDDAKWNDPLNRKHRAQLVKYINHTCMKAGFAITVKAWNPGLVGGGVLRLRCSQNRPFKGEMDAGKSEKQQCKINTSKPICAEEACPFIFNMHWFDEFGRWGLKAHSGKHKHFGHTHQEEQNIKCATSKFLKNQLENLSLTPAAWKIHRVA